MEALAIIQGLYPLREPDLSRLASLFEPVEVPKNTTIIAGDYSSKYLYFVQKGSCRIFYYKEEKEVILDFAFAGDGLISLNSYVYGKPGYEHIQTMEDSSLYRVSSQALQSLFQDSLGIANWGRRLAEVETLKIEYRLMSKLFKTAAESYQELMERAPNIIHHIKLGFVASYLGISQVTLSRIRAKI